MLKLPQSPAPPPPAASQHFRGSNSGGGIFSTAVSQHHGPLALAFTGDGPLELSPLNLCAGLLNSPVGSAVSPRGPLRWPSPPEKSDPHTRNPTSSSLRRFGNSEGTRTAVKEQNRQERKAALEHKAPQQPPKAIAKRPTFDENLKRVLLRMEQRPI